MSDLDNNGIRFDTLYDYIVYFANSQFKGKEIYRCCHSEDSGYKENKTEELSRMASKKSISNCEKNFYRYDA